jgi:hypothetical protein
MIHPLSLMLGLTVCLVAAFPAARAQAQNLVQNPGFEQSVDANTSPGWTANTTCCGENNTIFLDKPSYAHSGDWSAQFSETTLSDAMAGALSQVIATRPMTAYTVSFFLSNSEGPENSFTATFGGQTVLSLTNSPLFGFTEYSATIVATSTSSTLSFVGEQAPGYFELDDVSVTQAAPAPVTGGGVLSFAAAAGLMVLRRLRRTR